MNGLTNTDLAHLARLQIAQRKEEAKARRLGRAVRAARLCGVADPSDSKSAAAALP